jgi:hypothetical protein
LKQANFLDTTNLVNPAGTKHEPEDSASFYPQHNSQQKGIPSTLYMALSGGSLGVLTPRRPFKTTPGKGARSIGRLKRQTRRREEDCTKVRWRKTEGREVIARLGECSPVNCRVR